MIKRPNSRVNLDKAIERLFGSYAQSTEARSVMAGAIVGQMLKCGVVKGGCGRQQSSISNRTVGKEVIHHVA